MREPGAIKPAGSKLLKADQLSFLENHGDIWTSSLYLVVREPSNPLTDISDSGVQQSRCAESIHVNLTALQRCHSRVFCEGSVVLNLIRPGFIRLYWLSVRAVQQGRHSVCSQRRIPALFLLSFHSSNLARGGAALLRPTCLHCVITHGLNVKTRWGR